LKDPVTEMAAFKAGEIDFIASFPPDHVDTMRAQAPKAQILSGKRTTPMLAAMKVTVPQEGKPMSPDRGPHAHPRPRRATAGARRRAPGSRRRYAPPAGRGKSRCRRIARPTRSSVTS